ncbi:PREDICTED: agrin-like [Priapulus caudatus]|uniref:Agrin-like n=1 Tax=Priapulus caudatus TaxID=37621 RepID=A0ABM1ESA1_PRICU|nr:PREDICTED: agrin-like [Priapulus caudatus]
MRHTTMRRTTDGATTRDGATRDDGYLTTGAPPLTTAAATDEPEREGLIGSVCFSKYECRVPLADCYQGRCRCPKHYAPSSNKDVCIAASAGIAKGDSVCGGDSCHRGATCMNVNAEHFKCICPIGRGGATCDEDHSYNIPAFSGTSWMRFKHMMAHSQVTIEIEFKPLYEDGIIIYNGQSVDGKGDFISLAIRSGYLEYRFDWATEPSSSSRKPRIELRRFYFVTLSRFNQDGRMKIEGVGR